MSDKQNPEEAEKAEVKNPLAEVNPTEVLNQVYEAALGGVPMVSRSVDDLANDYLTKHKTAEGAAIALVNNQVLKCSTSGFLTGLGGAITMPAALTANIGSVLYMQMRMIAAVAQIGGYDPSSDQVQTLVYLCLTGTSINDVLKSAGIKIGTRSLKNLIGKIPGAVITKINQMVGMRLVTKFGTKGVVNLGKLVPVAGGVIGGGMDFAATKAIGNNAIKMFIAGEVPDGETTDDNIIDIELEENLANEMNEAEDDRTTLI